MVALWIVLIVLFIWLALSELPAGADGHMPLPYLLAFVPWIVVPALALAVVGLCLHQWGYMCCALVCALGAWLRPSQYIVNNLTNINTAQAVADYYERKRQEQAIIAGEGKAKFDEQQRVARARAKDTAHDVDAVAALVDGTVVEAVPSLLDLGSFNVMTLNCRYGRANAHEIVANVRARGVCVLALQELTVELVENLHDEGLDELLPFYQLGEQHESTDNGGFNGIWTCIEPLASQEDAVKIPAADVPMISVPVNRAHSDAIAFASAHTKSPMRSVHDWSAGIIGLGELAQEARFNRDPEAAAAAAREKVAIEDMQFGVQAVEDEYAREQAAKRAQELGEADGDASAFADGGHVHGERQHDTVVTDTSDITIATSRGMSGAAVEELGSVDGSDVANGDASNNDTDDVLTNRAENGTSIATTNIARHTHEQLDQPLPSHLRAAVLKQAAHIVHEAHEQNEHSTTTAHETLDSLPKIPDAQIVENIDITKITELTSAPAFTTAVVLGDLNCSTEHPSFRKLLNSGFHDAALTEAKGMHASFPSWLPFPRIVLDHVLISSRALTPSDVTTVKIDGSDHLAVVAKLTVKS